jgi:uncharacterized protein (DUF983 family)
MKNMFKRSKPVEKTKSVHGERLTQWEKNFIWECLEKAGSIICPQCESTYMYEGPSGGMSTNIRCPRCGQGINFMLLPGRYDVSALDWCDNIGIDGSWKASDAQLAEMEVVNVEELLKSNAENTFDGIGARFVKIYNSFINWLNS